MVANLTLEEGEQWLPAIVDPIRSQKFGKLPDGNFGGLGLRPHIDESVKRAGVCTSYARHHTDRSVGIGSAHLLLQTRPGA